MSAAALSWAERRRFPRVSLPPALGLASLGARDGRRPAASVLDFSPGGVALPADQLEVVKDDAPLSLRIAGEEFECSMLSLRANGSHTTRERVGVALDFDQRTRTQVARLYHRARFPSLVRRTEVPAEGIRTLLRQSGYMALRPSLEPDGAWLRAEWPTTLSHEAVFRQGDGQAAGHIAITRAYRNSWLGHEIAMLPRTVDNLRCRRDLYQHFCVWPRLVDGDDAYVFGYYSPKRRFHQEMFEAFARESSADDCVIVRMERYMRHAEWPETPDGCLDAYSVGPMTSAEEPEILGMLERAWPSLARVALDIGPGRLTQERLHPEFAMLGGHRARECVVVKAGGRLIAALLCEWEDRRLSLFDALSVAHVLLTPGVVPNPQLENALVCILRDFYTARGANIPLFACPPGTFERRDVPGFTWVETMGCIVFSARALRAFEVFVGSSLDATTAAGVAPSIIPVGS